MQMDFERMFQRVCGRVPLDGVQTRRTVVVKCLSENGIV